MESNFSEINQQCCKIEKCPIFREGVLMNSITGESYKMIYCLKKKHEQCKRFLVSKIYNKPIPVQVLPNNFMSPEEIVRKLEQGYWDKK
jgi:hypothetical protein